MSTEPQSTSAAPPESAPEVTTAAPDGTAAGGDQAGRGEGRGRRGVFKRRRPQRARRDGDPVVAGEPGVDGTPEGGAAPVGTGQAIPAGHAGEDLDAAAAAAGAEAGPRRDGTVPADGDAASSGGPARSRPGRTRRGRSGGRGEPRAAGAGETVGADGDADEDLPVLAKAATVGLDATDPRRRNNAAARAADDDLPKLHKVLADAGIGSRRDMEELILAGRVSVNGQPAHVGQRIGPTDLVRINGRPVKRKAVDLPPKVLLYHKPPGEIVSRDEPESRPKVFEKLPRLKGARWVAVGRLDFNTEGLLIFTTSGDVANRLSHPRYGWSREYAVRVLGRVDEEAHTKLLAGVQLEDGPAAFSTLEEIGGDGANCWYRAVISEGRNREVRRMFEAVGLTVSRLVRISFGPVALPRGLRRGRWVELPPGDVSLLMQALRQADGKGSGGAKAADGAAPGPGSARGPRPQSRRGGAPAEAERPVRSLQPIDPRLPPQPDLPWDDDVDVADDEWQPTSQDAHLEAISRAIRKGDGTVAKPVRRRGPGRPGAPGAGFGAGGAGFGGGGFAGQRGGNANGNVAGNRGAGGGNANGNVAGGRPPAGNRGPGGNRGPAGNRGASRAGGPPRQGGPRRRSG
mgnify:CR=1 FL=1